MSNLAKNNHIIAIEITKDLDNMYYKHVKNIARNLRKVDMEELGAVVQCMPEDDVLNGYKNSTRKWLIIKHEDNLFIPIALFGVQAHGRVGIPWMVATDRLTNMATFLMKNCYKYLNIIKEKYDILVNFVDARNTDSIRWLRRIGFTLDDAEPYGHKRLPFHRFYMECK